MSFEQNTAGGRTTPRVDAPLGWPILARLPHAGGGSGLAEAASKSNFSHTDGAAPVANPALDVINHRQATHTRGESGTIRSPHLAVEAYQWPELDSETSPADRMPAPRREYLRIDAPDQRLGRGTRNRQANNSLATRAYQWHSALAPHAGVAVTVALILSATLLYWLTLGQGRPASDYENILDHENTWSSEAPFESRIAVDDPADSAPNPGIDFPTPSSATPRIAEAVPQPMISAPQPSGEAPVAAAGASAPIEESTVDESAAVTPTQHSAPYPVTDYASLDFALPGAVEPVAAAGPVSAEMPVAEGPAEAPPNAAN